MDKKKITEQRVFQHQCITHSCTYLGEFTANGAYEGYYELYVCKPPLSYPTLIARYGDVSEDVVVARELADLPSTHPCMEALRRAKTRGLL